MKKKYLSILALSMALTTSCNFLDVMPDKLGTIEYAFRDQVSAEKYTYQASLLQMTSICMVTK